MSSFCLPAIEGNLTMFVHSGTCKSIKFGYFWCHEQEQGDLPRICKSHSLIVGQYETKDEVGVVRIDLSTHIICIGPMRLVIH